MEHLPGSGTEIREAVERDAGKVAELWTEAYVTLGVGGRSEPYTPADFFASSRQGSVLVADGPDGINGAVVLHAPAAPGRVVAASGEAELSRLAVAARARGRGIGRALAEACGSRARAAGWAAIALWSRPRQGEAHRLYESLGYVRVPKRDSVDASGHGRLVYRLALDPDRPRPGAG
jgi:ribosomal protein S18 acetylase RimI-like enzyme